jgi:hypothetical protein
MSTRSNERVWLTSVTSNRYASPCRRSISAVEPVELVRIGSDDRLAKRAITVGGELVHGGRYLDHA